MSIRPLVVIRTIENQSVHEEGVFGPLNLNDYIQSPDAQSHNRFFAELSDGRALPRGIMCTPQGILSGVPPKGTMGEYDIVVIAENDTGIPVTTEFKLSIQPSIAPSEPDKNKEWWSGLKKRVWDALGQNLAAPDLSEMYKQPITSIEIYYLLQRYATLTIWDAYNLDLPSDKIILQLDEVGPHYHVYDRGSCLVGAPRDLFSYQRTLSDSLQMARAMAKEAYRRNWTIQLAGFHKLMRVAWIELQLLSNKFGKKAEVLHYIPLPEDLKIYRQEIDVGKRFG